MRTNIEIRAAILLFIYDYTRQFKQSPTTGEICEACDVSPGGHITYHLNVLEGAGLIRRQYRKPRSTTLTPEAIRIIVEDREANGP